VEKGFMSDVTFLADDDAEMVRIMKDDVEVFEGNWWDLPGDPAGWVALLAQLGFNAKLGTYTYE
jgi:hypothetical protein